MRIDNNACIGILNAMGDGKFHYVEDLPTIYNDVKCTVKASEADIAEGVLGMYALKLITQDSVGSLNKDGAVPIILTKEGSEIRKHLEGFKNFTGRYQKYFVV